MPQAGSYAMVGRLLNGCSDVQEEDAALQFVFYLLGTAASDELGDVDGDLLEVRHFSDSFFLPVGVTRGAPLIARSSRDSYSPAMR